MRRRQVIKKRKKRRRKIYGKGNFLLKHLFRNGLSIINRLARPQPPPFFY